MKCKTLMNKLADSVTAVQHVIARRTGHTRPSSVPLHRLRNTEQTGDATNKDPQQLAERPAMTGITEAAGSATLVITNDSCPLCRPAYRKARPGARPWAAAPVTKATKSKEVSGSS
ncbi:TPA: hypothetical protein ACH3X1_009150 [Trebouxia sp. C0004]